ncbi:AAA family ATPase [Bdellovibrionota bacterium FG-2]
MAHARVRHAEKPIRNLAKFWPVVGVIGLRQCGKTTLLEKNLHLPNFLSFDDEEVRNEAQASGKVFLSRHQPPLALDEVQKAPELFDAIKHKVDRKRIPGQYYLTGSVRFTSLEAVRESLTGRIGLLQLHPFTLAEAHKKELVEIHPLPKTSPRFSVEEFSQNMALGGLPVPLFTRDVKQRWNYFDQWVQTLLLRDLRHLIRGRYDPEFAQQILQEIGKILLRGELATNRTLPWPAAKIGKYLLAFENCFVLRKINPHPAGVGQSAYLFGDSGLAWFFMNQAKGEEGSLSLARHFLLNELFAGIEYNQSPVQNTINYFQHAKSKPVDLVWNDIPMKMVISTRLTHLGWEERALEGAMKVLKQKSAYLIAPVEKSHPVNRKGIGVLSWSAWS